MKDLIDITVEAGSGGEGLISFDSWQKPTGGNGGKGGDIYFVGSRNYLDFSHLEKQPYLKAESGKRGERNRRDGKNGKDLIVHLPLVTRIFNPDGSEVITITKDEQKVRILKGATGGLGNFALRSKGWDSKFARERGVKGEVRKFKLELNLKADAIFLGFPNAGKSSLINALTNAKYKVAPYEFTTLEPQLAVMDGYILMDLPGLIEGAYRGKGLGTNFLKHTKYSRLLVHCISLEDMNLKESYTKMRDEFNNISKDLSSLDELVLFTKADILSTEQERKILKELSKDFKDFLIVSTFRKEDVDMLKETLKKRLGSSSHSII
ncbi:MAG: GTPase [Candidatus Dojkabacteria bacterium]